ncbi:C9 [Bugula neritina]|uniref:C9 n=1 Tax=Bugula neritina TaxID=10212 RepID=A0A7J7J5T6_BUGNE|nr:C9 [Bugula neritina]
MDRKVLIVLLLAGIIGCIAAAGYYGHPGGYHRGSHGRSYRYWGSWSSWSRCSRTCGGGTQSRLRRCITGYGYHHGGSRGCYGRSYETRRCNTGCCPVDGGWSYWSNWSRTYRSKVQTRTRTCSRPYPRCGGRYCRGPTKQTRYSGYY